MARYLDPKSDIVFKKIFGEHPHLLKSFLNAVLPLPNEGLIESLVYLPSEQVPVIPVFKNTIVDVRCTDQQGQVFIVEMQVQWTKSFMQRMLFNASKAYVKQLEKGEEYDLLKPVYGLGLINTTFDPNKDDWYHHYKMVNVKKTGAEIKDLQLLLIELPKFKAKSFQEKRLQVLWLRFMSELGSKTNKIPSEWLEVSEIKQAAELAEEAAYTPAELVSYDKYWDAVSVEKTLLSDVKEQGVEEGINIGMEKGIDIGIDIGMEKGIGIGEQKTKEIMARKLLLKGLSIGEVVSISELPLARITALAKKIKTPVF